MRLLERVHLPRILAALLLILALFGTIVGLGTAISGPTRTWAAKLPEGIPRLQERLSFMREPINQACHQPQKSSVIFGAKAVVRWFRYGRGLAGG
jgi:predicted PurR-regulated permease PerM